MTVKTVDLDLTKDVFQVHCVSVTGPRIINSKIKRAKPIAFFETLPRCLVRIEVCKSRRSMTFSTATTSASKKTAQASGPDREDSRTD